MDPAQIQVEREKAVLGYLKHLTTLSTGAILLIAGFFQNVFIKPEIKFVVGIAIVGFSVSVLGCVIALSVLSFTLGLNKEQASRPMETVFDIAVACAWIGFLIGVISISTFIFFNFFI